MTDNGDSFECQEVKLFLPSGTVTYRPGLRGEPKQVTLHGGILEVDYGAKGAQKLYINCPMEIRLKTPQ